MMTECLKQKHNVAIAEKRVHTALATWNLHNLELKEDHQQQEQ